MLKMLNDKLFGNQMLKNVCSNSCIEGVFREMSVSFPDYVQIITGVLLNFAMALRENSLCYKPGVCFLTPERTG